MDPSGSIFSSAKVEKWDRAEVKDLTDYLTVKESTTENTVKIWPSLLKKLVVGPENSLSPRPKVADQRTGPVRRPNQA